MKKYDRNRNLVIIIFILSVCPFYYLVILSAYVGREDFLVFRARSWRAGLERRNYGALNCVRKTLLQIVHQETRADILQKQNETLLLSRKILIRILSSYTFSTLVSYIFFFIVC